MSDVSSLSPSSLAIEPLSAEYRAVAADLLLDRSDSSQSGLSKAEAAAIAQRMHAGKLRDGDRFRFGAGPRADHAVLLVLHGEVSIQVRMRDRAPVAMSASSGRGEFLGLISAFGGSISPAVVRVNEDSVFAVLFRADLQLLAKASPLAYGKLMHLFTCELAKLGAEFMARFAVMDRLTRGLQLELANHTPEDESNGEARDARAFIETFELR